MRGRNWGTQLTVLVLFMFLCFISSFVVFWRVAAPFCGERLHQHIDKIAAGFFPIAGILLILFSVLGMLWLSFSQRKWIYEPLSRLIRAANALRDGNLGYELPLSGLGQFTKLGQAFEAMRVRLRDGTEQSQKAECERIDLMNNICHDLKTPVTSILGYAEGILEGVADSPEKVQSYVETIAKKARRMSDLVEGLNLLTVLENSPPLSLEPLDIGEWMQSIADDLAGEMQTETEIETGLICAADRQKLSRVLYNLADNAVKYARPAEGQLCLRLGARRLDDTALLTIWDNGPGLPQQDTRKVFDRFYRADPARGTIGGSGLGLSIARQIVRLHKGKIWMQNHKSGGLLVSISLPLYERNAV